MIYLFITTAVRTSNPTFPFLFNMKQFRRQIPDLKFMMHFCKTSWLTLDWPDTGRGLNMFSPNNRRSEAMYEVTAFTVTGNYL
jgi:hypothetical protein